MLDCRLRWSRIETAFQLCCHLVAGLTVLQAELRLLLEALLLTAVAISFACYLRARFLCFYAWRRGSWRAVEPVLQLAPQFSRIHHRGVQTEAEPPLLRYLSEFLIVLELPYTEGRAKKTLALVLWPDSLSRRDNRRLRRYLRFELS